AAGLCVGAIGTDTGSSIRRPSAFCGTVGLKPGYGRVSRNGVMMVAWSLDHVGPIADSMFDAVALLDAIAGPDREDQSCGIEPWHPMLPTLVTPHGLRRAGIPRRWVESMCEPAVAARFDEACRTAESLGLQLVDIDPPHREALQPALRLISLVEAYVVHEAQFAERGARYSDELAALVRVGRAIPAPDYVKAQQLRARVRAWLNETFQTIDLILSPTMPVVAPPMVASVDPITPPSVVGDTSGLFCALAPLGGMQSISVPMGLAGNLPCGVLLTSPVKHERASMRLAAALEARLPVRAMPPL
ncbi:MAG: amidase, partial [Burkholderiales bacterium]